MRHAPSRRVESKAFYLQSDCDAAVGYKNSLRDARAVPTASLPGLEVLLGSQTALLTSQSNHMASMLHASRLATSMKIFTLEPRPRRDGTLSPGLRLTWGKPGPRIRGPAVIKILGNPPISCMRTYPREQHRRAPAQCACLRSNAQRSKPIVRQQLLRSCLSLSLFPSFLL
jgi:hypothetical protein